MPSRRRRSSLGSPQPPDPATASSNAARRPPGKLLPGLQERTQVFPGLHGAHEQHVGFFQAVPRRHRAAFPGGCGEVGFAHSGVDDGDFRGVEAEEAHGVVPGGLGDGDQAACTPHDALREQPSHAHVGGRVHFRHQPQSRVVDGGGDTAIAGRLHELVRGVKEIEPAAEPVQQPPAQRVGGVQQSEARHRARRPGHGALVHALPDAVEQREQLYALPARQPHQVPGPVIDVRLDAGAAQQQRCGVNANPHRGSLF